MNEAYRLYEHKKGAQEKWFRNPQPRKRQKQGMKGSFPCTGVRQTRLDKGNAGNRLRCDVGKATGKIAGCMSIGGMELSQPLLHYVRLCHQALSQTMDGLV